MGTETGEGEATDGFECVLRFLQQMAGGFFSFENERRIRIGRVPKIGVAGIPAGARKGAAVP